MSLSYAYDGVLKKPLDESIFNYLDTRVAASEVFGGP